MTQSLLWAKEYFKNASGKYESQTKSNTAKYVCYLLLMNIAIKQNISSDKTIQVTETDV